MEPPPLFFLIRVCNTWGGEGGDIYSTPRYSYHGHLLSRYAIISYIVPSLPEYHRRGAQVPPVVHVPQVENHCNTLIVHLYSVFIQSTSRSHTGWWREPCKAAVRGLCVLLKSTSTLTQGEPGDQKENLSDCSLVQGHHPVC